MPQLFLDAAEEPWINSTAAPIVDPNKEEESASYHEQLADYVRILRSIAGQSGFIADSMRMSVHICALAHNVDSYRRYLIENAARQTPRGLSAHEETLSQLQNQQGHDKDYHCQGCH